MAKNEAKLHRVEEGANSDWEKIPENERTRLQKIAAATNGIITPANILDAAGVALFAKGANDFRSGHYVKGVAEMGVSRLVDLGDGALAAYTNTKSLLGAGVDAGIDALEVFIALPIMQGTQALDPLTVSVTGVQRTVNSVASIVGKARGVRIDAHEAGKLWTGIMWGSALGAMAARAVIEKAPVASRVLKTVGTIGVLASAAKSMPATIDYVTKGFGPRPTNAGPATDLFPIDFTDFATVTNKPTAQDIALERAIIVGRQLRD